MAGGFLFESRFYVKINTILKLLKFRNKVFKNRKHLNKIMAAVMIVVVISMIMALFGSALIK